LNEDTIDFVLAMSLLSVVQDYELVFPLFLETWQTLRMQISYIGLPKFGADCYIIIYAHNLELMKSVGSHVSSSLLSVINVMV
jgi:hypothetical protein